MPTTLAPELVLLRDGVAVSLRALRLVWELEERCCYVDVASDGVGLLVGPRALITEADRVNIRTHRAELLSIVRYCTEADLWGNAESLTARREHHPGDHVPAHTNGSDSPLAVGKTRQKEAR
jgi:hypothetical protein